MAARQDVMSEDVVKRVRLISDDEREFLAGSITAEQYWSREVRQPDALVWQEAVYGWRQLRRVVSLFVILASVVYVVVAIFFLLRNRTNAGVSALAISVALVVSSVFLDHL